MAHLDKGPCRGGYEPSGFLPNYFHGTTLSYGEIDKARTEGHQQTRDDVHTATRWVNPGDDAKLDASAMHMGSLNAIKHRFIQA